LGDYYVYELIDSRDGSPFYVGKGKGRRVDQHERQARKGTHSPKCNRIRAIWDAGGKVEKRIVREFAREDDAYAFEAQLVERHGLQNLTNIVKGGRLEFGEDPELTRDKTAIRLFAKAASKSNGFSPDMTLGMNYCGRWFQLPDELVAKIRQWALEVKDRRGLSWVQEIGRKWGVEFV
jgi:hypothetical protein